MNAKARALGLRGTHFANPHGLDQPGNYSTAHDVVRLLRAALREPFIRTWAGRTEARVGGRDFETTDDLLTRIPALVAGKTGHTDDAGWSQVALASARGVTIVAAVLGAQSRGAQTPTSTHCCAGVCSSTRPVLVVAARHAYAFADPGWGLDPVRLTAEREIVRPAAVRRPLVERVVAPQVLALPVRRGQRLGEVRVYDGDRLVAQAPLVADRDVQQPGFGAKAAFVAGRTVHHLAGLVS